MNRVLWPAAIAALHAAAACGGGALGSARPSTAQAARPHERSVLLVVRSAPPHGVVMGPVVVPADLPGQHRRPAATATVRGRPVPVQVLPRFAGRKDRWLAVLKLPGGGDHRVRLKLSRQEGPRERTDKVSVRTRWLTAAHDPARMGGLPRRIEFADTKKVFEKLAWNERVHHKKLGSYHLRYDAHAKVELVSRGPVCTVVRTRARYVKPAELKAAPPDSRPRAVYDWLYFHDLPLVFVRVWITQERPFAWSELHFLELNFPDRSFPGWAGGEPLREGTFSAAQKGFSFANWGLLRDGPNAIGLVRGGRALFHDGRGGYGTYLHAYGAKTWQGWKDDSAARSAWLWMGTAADPVREIRRAGRALPSDAQVLTTLPSLREKIEAARNEAAAAGPADRRRRMHAIAMAERLEAQGRWALAEAQLAGRQPPNWATVVAGDLALTLEAADDGLRFQGLFDLAAGAELSGSDSPPLFVLTLRHVKTGRLIRLPADAGWAKPDIKADGDRLTIHWRKPREQGLSGLGVSATALMDAPASRIRWKLQVTRPPKQWGVWRVVFPQVSLRYLGRDLRVLFPRGPGEVKADVWRGPFYWKGMYPSGWATMQFLAAYDAQRRRGLYFAMHDPAAHTKDILAERDSQAQHLRLAFDHPAPNMGVGGTGFSLSGHAVWQVLRGDWFDAALIYRDWVRKEARWYPDRAPEGRPDTPKWMRELCIWGMLGGAPKSCINQGVAFAKYMGLPTAFHWYNWHKIPFDNDYPHYFPPKDGFQEAVAKLQSHRPPIYIMPYINARLWDTRDKGHTDFEFTKLARAAATKNEKGEVYTEAYGSKESDGSRVKLAPMCPATKLWQERVRGIVLRLLKEYGTKAVYLDQVAAAHPPLCFDRSHGHPLGGGGWWVASYGKLLSEIRKAMPAGCVLTTECNAEPFLRWFDGYLTWHWQHDGQVPAFPAIYGGAVQMFGRAYRGGPTKDLALRMKAAQQLVFGEQIGWISATVVAEQANAAFLRQMARLRHHLRRYFHAGQMARPPKLAWPGKNAPTATADWQWQGVWPVTTDAVLTGAWELPGEKKLVLIFVNVSDRPLSAHLPLSLPAYGLSARSARLTAITPDGARRGEPIPANSSRKIVFHPHKAFAWEISLEPAK